MVSNVEKQWRARQRRRELATTQREFTFWWTYLSTDAREHTRAQRLHARNRIARKRHNPARALMALAKTRAL